VLKSVAGHGAGRDALCHDTIGRIEPPTVDDRAIWDLWLSQYKLPVVLVADELDIFGLLHTAPADVQTIASRSSLSTRGAEAIMAVLAASGFVVQHQGRFQLTDLSRTYLLKGSDVYWVPMLRNVGGGRAAAESLMRMLRTDNLAPDDRISRRWERGEMTPEDARGGNRHMHSHSFPAALGLARNADLGSVRRLLDMAGGSGCFSIALASRYPELRCTVADLPPVAADTLTYIQRYGCEDRVDTLALNMFDEAWPSGYDAIFFSNVFHDWDPGRREDLARRSFQALPPGGRILLHEMLLNSTKDGPLTAALFSVLMLGTRGKQFSADELDTLLRSAGFADTRVVHTYGYYSLVSATKPT
jgi:hypothetical protein